MIFLDTSFIVSYYNESDENHHEAKKVMKYILDNFENVGISDYVFNECATVLFYRLKDLDKVAEICSVLMKIIKFRINESVFVKTWDIFINQKDTKFSFTDCSILAVIDRYKVKNLVTFDKDFKKMKGLGVIGCRG